MNESVPGSGEGRALSPKAWLAGPTRDAISLQAWPCWRCGGYAAGQRGPVARLGL